VSWTDNQGLAHSKQLTASAAGSDHLIALPTDGDTPRISLDGDQASAAAPNAGTGALKVIGTYQGFYSRDFQYTVTDAGQLPSDPVSIRATWTDDQGQAHSENLTFNTSGQDGAVELPGSEGVKIYLDNGTYAAGDTYTYNLRLDPPHAGEALYFNVDNGAFVTGDSFHYSIDKDPLSVLDTLKEWQHRLAGDDAEAAQTQSQRTLESINQALKTIMDYIADSGTRQNRITVRENVLEDHTTYHSKNLQDLQDVDLTQAFMDLRAQQTAYDASLKVISVMKDLFLASYL
jgi:flagellin-like hook-associated protein FlgL